MILFSFKIFFSVDPVNSEMFSFLLLFIVIFLFFFGYLFFKGFRTITVFYNFKIFKEYLNQNNLKFEIKDSNNSLLYKYIKNEKTFMNSVIEIIKGPNFYMEYIQCYKYEYREVSNDEYGFSNEENNSSYILNVSDILNTIGYGNDDEFRERRIEKVVVPHFIGYIVKYKLDKNYNVNILIKPNNVLTDNIIFFDIDKNRVKLDNPMFEKYFDVFSSDQINTRVYFNQKRMMTFIDLVTKKELKSLNLGYIKIVDDYALSTFNKTKIYDSEDIKNFLFNRKKYDEKLTNNIEQFFDLINKFYISLK